MLRSCPYCDRSRGSLDALEDHLAFWHSLSRHDAVIAANRSPDAIPDWIRPAMDERSAALRQQELFPAGR